MPTPHAANTPMIAIGNASTRVQPYGFNTTHKGGQRAKSNAATSKNVANSIAANARIKRGNEPNLPRLASPSRTVPAAITIQL